MVHIKNHKHRVMHRLKIVHGHLAKIIQMVEQDTYCIDVLHQSLAVQKALKKIDGVIMEDHLATCVPSKVKAGKTSEMVQELIDIYQYK